MGFVLIAIWAVPFYTFVAILCGRGLLHRKQLREKRAATWTTRWGAQAVHAYQNSVEIQALGYFGLATAIVLLFLTAWLARGAPSTAAVILMMVFGGVFILGKVKRVRALRMIARYQQLPEKAIWSLPQQALRDPTRFDAWLTTHNS